MNSKILIENVASETVVSKPTVEMLGQNNNNAFLPHKIKRLGNLFWSYWTCTYLR